MCNIYCHAEAISAKCECFWPDFNVLNYYIGRLGIGNIYMKTNVFKFFIFDVYVFFLLIDFIDSRIFSGVRSCDVTNNETNHDRSCFSQTIKEFDLQKR